MAEDHPAGSPRPGLIHTDHLPLSWQPLETARWEAMRTGILGQCADTLRAILALELSSGEKVEQDPGVAHELQRLEIKLDLLSGLIAQFIAEQSVRPPRREVRLGAEGLGWSGDPCAAVGSLVLVSVFLSSRYPQPVQLPARVVAQQGERTDVQYVDLPEALHEDLERLLFLYHRRQVAGARRG